MWFLFYRIPFKGFMQRYGLIAKYSHVKSGIHSSGKYSSLWDQFQLNVCMLTVDKECMYFLSLGLLIYSPFPSLDLLVNETLSSLLSWGLSYWCITRELSNKISNFFWTLQVNACPSECQSSLCMLLLVSVRIPDQWLLGLVLVLFFSSAAFCRDYNVFLSGSLFQTGIFQQLLGGLLSWSSKDLLDWHWLYHFLCFCATMMWTPENFSQMFKRFWTAIQFGAKFMFSSGSFTKPLVIPWFYLPKL